MNVLIVGGGGTLGSTTAAYLACRGLADTIYLLDINRNAVEYHAVDMEQAAFSVSHTKIKVGSWEDLRECQLMIIAAGLPASVATHDAQKDLASLMPTVREIAGAMQEYNPEVVVLSMTNPLDVFNYVLYATAKLPARQFLALSQNDTIRFRQAIGAQLNCDPSRVDGIVVGEHGQHKVYLFSQVTVDGERASFTAEERQQILQHANDWWSHFLKVSNGRAAAWTTSVSAGQVVEHILGLRKGGICCSVIQEEGQGYSMGWPVELGQGGVNTVIQLELTEDEWQRVEAVKETLKETTRSVLDYLALQ